MTRPTAPAPCPPPGSNNKYHLTTDPKDSLTTRVLRVIGYVLLHIITLGILLLIHYYRHHTIRERGLPPPPVPIPPKIETITIAKKPPPKEPEKPSKPEEEVKGTPPSPVKQPEEEPQQPPKPLPGKKPLRIPIFTLPKVPGMPPRISHGSIEAMEWQQTRGFVPDAALFTLPGRPGINPQFVASYPTRISQSPSIPYRHCLEDPKAPSIPEHLRAYVEQINYLNQNYYIVEVPGDGSCFYHSYAIGWLYSLYEAFATNPRVFVKEANHILQHPFAQSSEEAAELSCEVANILRSCATCPTLQQFFDSIILSKECSDTLVAYLQKVATHAVRQQIDSLGEENARAAYIADLEEALLPETLEHLGQQRPVAPFLQNIILHQSSPLTSASDQLLLILEYLPWIFLTEGEKCSLSPEEKANQELLERELHNLLASLDAAFVAADSRWVGKNFQEEVFDKLSQKEKNYVSRFSDCITKRHPQGLPYSKMLLLLACISTSPSLKSDALAQAFCSEAEQIIRQSVGSQVSLAEFLQLDEQRTLLLKQGLDRCWEQKCTAELVISLLLMPDSQENAHNIPQAEKLFRAIARLLRNGLRATFDTGGPLESHQKFLKQNIEKLSAALYASEEWEKQFEKFCQFPSLRLQPDSKLPADQERLYTKGMQLFFFILQHPHFLKDPLTKVEANNIKNLLMPYLQFCLKKSENFSVLRGLTTAILGTALLSPPLPEEENADEALRKTSRFCAYFANRPEAMILDSDLEAKLLLLTQKVFPGSSPLTAEAKKLQAQLLQAYPQEWNNFVSRLNIFGYKGEKYPQASPPDEDSLVKKLPEGMLLLSFLLNYPDLRTGESPLAKRLQAYTEEASKAYRNEVKHFAPLLVPTLQALSPKLHSFLDFKNTILATLVREPDELDPTAPTAFRESFLSFLRSFSAEQLQEILDAVKQQAESSHVAGLTSALHKPALCQLLDPTAGVPPQGAANHGFLAAGFASEAEAKIFLIRFPNHYGCLLRKNSGTL